MTITPQTNTTLEEIAEVIVKHDDFCICGHVNPDGDCIGSTLAMTHALRCIGKSAYPLIADDNPPDQVFSYMPGYDDLTPASCFDGACEVFICVDVPKPERLGEAASLLHDKAPLTITLDHHAYPERMSDFSYTDPDSASASLIIWKLASHLGISDSQSLGDISTCAYSGLLTDTGSFMFQNTNCDAFEMATRMMHCGIDPSFVATRLFQEKSLASIRIDSLAVSNMEILFDGKVSLSYISEADMHECGADKADTEGAINAIRGVRGVKVACILKERPTEIRGSLRAKCGIDVSALARRFGGGGHMAAAGFTLHCPLDEALAIMREELKALVV